MTTAAQTKQSPLPAHPAYGLTMENGVGGVCKIRQKCGIIFCFICFSPEEIFRFWVIGACPNTFSMFFNINLPPLCTNLPTVIHKLALTRMA